MSENIVLGFGLVIRDANKSTKVNKFYPENEMTNVQMYQCTDVSKIKSEFVNRYYGLATKVI